MQQIDDDLGFCPSFNCYSSDSLAATAAIKVSTQLLDDDRQVDRIHDIGEEDFEFSLALADEERVSAASSEVPAVFPLFDRDLLAKNEADREAVESNSKVVDDCSDSLAKLFVNEREPEESASSSSSSELDESEDEAKIFCAWRPKMDIGSSSPLSKCKKSSSTGSGSKRWRIRDLLRRSNSEGKEPMVLTLTPKPKVENIPKPKRNNGEVSIVSGKVSGKSKPSIHELLYVQQRAKREGGKRKSYLPYRQGLVGFFSNANGKGNKFPF